MTSRTDLPSADLRRSQASWLAPLRSRILRQVRIGNCRQILDLGAGDGTISLELLSRSGGRVVAFDRHPLPAHPDLTTVLGDSWHLPFPDATFDLIFSELALLWMPLAETLDEVVRVLAPSGSVAFVEPDFGAMIEYPESIETGAIWMSALSRAGADPLVGRRLPHELARRGLRTRVFLADRLEPPSEARFDLLSELPLTDGERARLDGARIASTAIRQRGDVEVAHLPFVAIQGERIL